MSSKTKKVKFVDIRVPKTKDDYRIRHARACMDPQFQLEKISLEGKLIFLSRLLGKSKQFIGSFDVGDMHKIYYRVMKDIGQMRIADAPPEKIEINGKSYELVDLERPPVSWVVDTEGSDLDKDPVRLACLCYIPEGTKYGEKDENKNALHPIKDRYKDFEDHFPLETFVQLNAFFLKQYERSATKYIQQKQAEKMTKRIINGARLLLTTGSWRSTTSHSTTTGETGSQS